ncbi:glucose-6-phosphate dehydrogenase [Melghirimyces algeriensis]|uniref:Glucose-6-phosphate 1-dehydrogenase n=1 Tax=Melghirimyces algeriensis TaxID=910412 RepID=A0A521CU70_9BACL|nr:glucose-6-phosphate 1-dehydrogenase [Melghirimyces algeriensis]
MSNKKKNPFVMVLFGGAGDLAKRKLFPALYGLYRNGFIHEHFSVIGLGRSRKGQEEYRQIVRQSVNEHFRMSVNDPEELNSFSMKFDYISLDVHDLDGYQRLREWLEIREKEVNIPVNRLFYLAISPKLFGQVSKNLKIAGLTEGNGWNRLVIEKPFGHDYESAKELNNQIRTSFAEEEIYRIDHYLGKEMVQNIQMIRFANTLFENMWNNRYISNIQITASETVGVGDRAQYYDHAGALRDMVQNHILQMVTLVAMEPPSRLKPEAIHDEKVKVLRSLRRWKNEDVLQNMIRGQYTKGFIGGQPLPSYREEEGVQNDSVNETFVSGRLLIDNFRWSGVPFYIRTGKRMYRKETVVVVQFKNVPDNLYFNKNNALEPNLLIININPKEGLSLQINAKQPGTVSEVVPIRMDFCHDSKEGLPEAYESLLHDATEGDRTYFTHWEEVALAWKFIDPIRKVWDGLDESTLSYYEAGSTGPKESDLLLKKEGFHWHDLGEQHGSSK